MIGEALSRFLLSRSLYEPSHMRVRGLGFCIIHLISLSFLPFYAQVWPSLSFAPTSAVWGVDPPRGNVPTTAWLGANLLQ